MPVRLPSFFKNRKSYGKRISITASEPMDRQKNEPQRLFRKPITKKKIVIYGLLAAALAVVVLICRFLFVTMIDKRAAFADPTPVPTRTHDASEPEKTLSPEEQLALEADKDFMKNRVNIILAGIDYTQEREGREDFRTDTLMLFSVDFSKKKVDILSIPRDSYADIAFTDQRWKINGAWMSAGGFEGRGFECMMRTIETTLGGIPVNYYVAVEMQAVKDIVDALGGVYYDVDYPINLDGTVLQPGYQLLSGKDVLNYCRERKDITSGTDIDRIDRQQRLLLAVFSELKSSDSLPKIPEIYNKLQSEIYTNLNFEQIAALVFFSLDINPETDISSHKLKGRYMRAYNATYYVLDHDYTQDVVKEIFGVDADIDWKYDIDYVEYDAAADTLEAAVKKADEYLSKHRNDIPDELKSSAESQISEARQTLASAQSQLDSARRKNSNKNIKSTAAIDSAAEDMASLYKSLENCVKHPPASIQTSEPSSTASPTASQSAPASTPSESPTASQSAPASTPSESPSPSTSPS